MPAPLPIAGVTFLPHGHCFLWTPWLVSAYAAADGAIALSYLSIPFALLYLARRQPRMEFKGILLLFCAFILACGATHLMSVWTIWHPDYVLDVSLRLVTAVLSVITAIVLWPLVPMALAIPTQGAIRDAIAKLEREVVERRDTEARLAELNRTMERNVRERTEELTATNRRLTAEIELRRKAEDRFRQVLEHSPVAKVMIGPGGIIELVNAQAEAMFMRSRSDLIGTTIESLVPAASRKDHPSLRAGYLAAPRPRPMGLGRELYAVRSDGTEFPVEIGLNPIETEEGTMVLSVIIDISERKQREQRLSAAIEERDVLLREIHHRVKNNLQVIESLLSIGFDQIHDPHVSRILEDCRNRVRSMAVIHQTLYESDRLSQVAFGIVLQKLVRNLVHSYESRSKAVEVVISADGSELPISHAVPCALLVNELITNSFKYAYPQDTTGLIYVDFSLDAQSGMTLLAVRDQGRGLPDDFDIDAEGTMGMQLVKLLSAQLAGTLTVHRARPTMFQVAFRNPRR